MKSQSKNNSPTNSNGQSKTVTYKFVTGETSVVEVSDEIAAFLAECDRTEASRERMERRHCFSLDAAEYEGTDYSDGTTPEASLIASIENDAVPVSLQRALSALTDIQKKRFLLFSLGKTYQEIAEIEGTSINAVAKSITASKRKMKKFF